MKDSSLPYRPGVGAVVFNRRGEVFVGRRINMIEDNWQLPQGGIDPGEEARAAVLREVSEEIGTAKVTILGETEDWLTYELPPHLVGKAWGGKYRGQRQKWYALRFDGADSDIDLETHHPEFNAWRWIPLVELEKVAVPFKLSVYRELVRQFSGIAQDLAKGGHA